MDIYVLEGLQFETCLVYLNVIIIYSETFDSHLEQSQEVFPSLQLDANLKFKPMQ